MQEGAGRGACQKISTHAYNTQNEPHPLRWQRKMATVQQVSSRGSLLIAARTLRSLFFRRSRHTSSVTDHPNTTSRYDVVLVGGGVMGSASAYFLSLRMPRKSVCVIERDLSVSLHPRSLIANAHTSMVSILCNTRIHKFSCMHLLALLHLHSPTAVHKGFQYALIVLHTTAVLLS